MPADGVVEAMRRKTYQPAKAFLILPLLLALIPLFGCAPSIDVSSDPANQIFVTSTPEDTTVGYAKAAELLSSGEIGTLSSAWPVLSAHGALPFVRSRPKLVPPFPLVLNQAVQSYIDGYLAQPQTLRQSFQRSAPFMPEMISLFDDVGLPSDLVYLSFAESRFSAGGAGPWQLNRTTARRYGLTINQWLDERRDPIKSTRAAAQYLAELHDQTGADWRMTLVAWNNGDEGVNRYIQLMTAPYERLMRRLPRRTRALMNRFMAVAFIARHAKEYGVDPMDLEQARRYRVIAVDADTPLRTVAQSNHTTVAVLRWLNPALLSDHTPPGRESYPVRVPDTTEVNLGSTSPT